MAADEARAVALAIEAHAGDVCKCVTYDECRGKRENLIKAALESYGLQQRIAEAEWWNGDVNCHCTIQMGPHKPDANCKLLHLAALKAEQEKVRGR